MGQHGQQFGSVNQAMAQFLQTYTNGVQQNSKTTKHETIGSQNDSACAYPDFVYNAHNAYQDYTEEGFDDEGVIIGSGTYTAQALPSRSRTRHARTHTQTALDLPAAYAPLFDVPNLLPTEQRSWYSHPSPQQSYLEAQALSAVEDNYPSVIAYQSRTETYRELPPQILRAYISWRTQLRHGAYSAPPLHFLKLYIREMIYGIHIADPEEGFQNIKQLYARSQDPDSLFLLTGALIDYAAYFDIDANELQELPRVAYQYKVHAFTEAKRALQNTLEPKVHRLFPLAAPNLEERMAMSLLDLTNNTREPLFTARKMAYAFNHVLCGVLLSLEHHYQTRRQRDLFRELFGSPILLSHVPFNFMQVYEAHPHADTHYVISPIQAYTCKQGIWTSTFFPHEMPGQELMNQIIQASAHAVRQAFDPSHTPEQQIKLPKYQQKFIRDELSHYQKLGGHYIAPVIQIDTSQLSAIRTTAAQLREALLTDEERADESCTVKFIDEEHADDCQHDTCASKAPADDEPICADETQSIQELLPYEREYLQALLDKRTNHAAHILTQQHCSLDLLVDHINELFFDILGDTLLELSNGQATIIDDYLEDLKGYLHHDISS
ncbi:TerB N-terminal domain-containing protein [Collinsella sp. zg1085]|uniref:TerB N-terminal domain-containing protein n=1 Tax=Collinsella sp. zg1085 TaxID=2844380 RepID=UPI001C0B3385|nr:TerB N-terminal domain-containing protein [Collinsella sp. zg1085]QWT17237.1 TerB N-terminal domain-containing protein [Collinsella sp. zg1085]